MKIVLALGIFLLLTLQSFSQSEWTWANPTPLGGTFYGCQYFKNFVFISFYGGIAKSTDSGLSWKFFNVGDGSNSHFFNDEKGLIGGSQGLYKTTNGGVTWISIHGAKNILSHDENFSKVFMASEYTYYAGYNGGSGEHLKITNDGGNTWQSKSFSSQTEWINEISF